MPILIKNILVGYDGFDRNEGLPALAVSLAQEHEARLHVLNVIPELPHKAWKSKHISAEEVHAALVENRRQQLEQLLATARRKGLNARSVIRIGRPHEELIREAISISADLLIVSDEPIHGDRRGFGTVTRKLLRECPCPVLAKRDHRRFKHRHVLAAVDVEPVEPGSESPNRVILDMAVTIARRAASRLIVLHVWSLWGENLLKGGGRLQEVELHDLLEGTRSERAQLVEDLMSQAKMEDIDARLELVKGEARDLLPSIVAAQDIDLVVMGTVCRAGLKSILIGNTAEKVLNDLTCSVLAVKPPGFVSPVSL